MVSNNDGKEMQKFDKDEGFRILSILVFLIIFVFIGIPLWWQTTNVYRVQLPYSEIESLASLSLKHYAQINLILADPTIKAPNLWELITKKADQQYPSHNWTINYSWNIRDATSEEKRLIFANKSPHETDEKSGSFNIYIKPFVEDVESIQGYCNYQRSYILINTKGINHLASEVFHLVTHKIVKQDFLRSMYTPPETRKRGSIESVKSLDATAAVDITFSLVIPQPELIDVKWDIERAVKEYVEPYLQKLSPYIKFDIKSQIIYTITLDVNSQYDPSTGYHIWAKSQLPHVINPIEGNLGSHISTNPTLNFVIYIPPKHQIPLHISNEQGHILKTNAFISPQWGGIMILNPNVSSSSYAVDLQRAMGVFLAQLRPLLGIPFQDQSKSQGFGIKDWEKEYLLRKYTQEQISVAASTLISLGKLLGTIKNIVIKDEIGNKIYASVASIKSSLKLLEQGYLDEAFRLSQQALLNSEEAFFDPSLLALLYFPDDEKYAIYVPLFLPITIPILLSIWTLWQLRSFNLLNIKKLILEK